MPLDPTFTVAVLLPFTLEMPFWLGSFGFKHHQFPYWKGLSADERRLAHGAP